MWAAGKKIIKKTKNKQTLFDYNYNRFKWSWKSARSEVFTIQPVEGYSSPGSCTNFEVSFHPSFVQCNCTSWAKLTIDNYKTVFDLELCGSCINLPSPKDTLKFSGPVRETYTKKFTLKNSYVKIQLDN